MGVSQFIAISSLSGRCKTSYRTLKPFSNAVSNFSTISAAISSGSSTTRSSSAHDRSLLQSEAPLQCAGRYPDTEIDYSSAGTTSATGPRAAICCRSIKDRCRRLKRHPQAATDGQLATHLGRSMHSSRRAAPDHLRLPDRVAPRQLPTACGSRFPKGHENYGPALAQFGAPFT